MTFDLYIWLAGSSTLTGKVKVMGQSSRSQLRKMLRCGWCNLEWRGLSSWYKKYCYFNTTNIFTFWRFSLYQRPSSEEVCSIPLRFLPW